MVTDMYILIWDIDIIICKRNPGLCKLKGILIYYYSAVILILLVKCKKVADIFVKCKKGILIYLCETEDPEILF
jgi:hypothetical protein